MPKVTVYMPTYNYGKYIREAINSVIAQKFNDWELIVINDGSTDNTKKVLEEFSGHEKIEIIHQERKGLAISNNIALRSSRGEYIMRLDADDYLDENALLVLSNILDTHPDVGLVYPDYYRVDRKGSIIDIERRKKIGEEAHLLDLPAHGACTMIRKSCLLQMGGYDESLECQDGYDLWIRFMEKYKPYNVNVPLFYYRQHQKSLTKNSKKILKTRQKLKRNYVEKRFEGKMPKVLAIIPARERSNVYSGLALKKIAGRPLIDYTLNETLKTKLIDKIVVTTDDESLLKYIKKFPRVIGIERPQELSEPNTRIEPTISFILKTLKNKKKYIPDAVMLLYIHSPLRKQSHIEKAIDTMLIYNVKSVVSVCEDPHFYYQHKKNGLVPLQKKRLLRLERDALYRENAAVYLSRTSQISKDSFFGDELGHIMMLQEESIKIDSEFNFWMAEKLLLEQSKKKKVSK
jgi:CMP-N-acetylneuraminic acid synthetase